MIKLNTNGTSVQSDKSMYKEKVMKRKTLFIIIVSLSLLCSCGSSEEEQQLLNSIEQAWQLGETALPEAQAHAEGLRDSVRESSEYVRQKYDLLTIRLRDKCDMMPSSPDSALQVTSYFEGRKDDVDKERAYYYAGSAYRDLKDYPRAVSFFLKAVDEAEKAGNADTLIWQNALSQLRFLYMLQLNYEEELNVALQAVALAKASPVPSAGGVRRNMGWYLMDAASAYKHLNDTLRCLQYCDQAYQAIQEEGFPAKYRDVLAHMLTIYSNLTIPQHDNLMVSQYGGKTDTLLQHLAKLPEEQRPYNYELGLALLHEHANRTDSAILQYKAYYDKEETLSGRYEAAAGLQRCYLQKKDFRQAAEWGCLLYDTNDSIIAQRAFEETQRAKDSYIYYRDKEKEQALVQRDERIIFVSVMAGLALLSILMGLTAFYYYRRKALMEEIVSKDRELQERVRELRQREKINRELTQIALMNNTADDVENIIAQFRKAAVGQARLEEDSWKELMAAIETLYPGFHEAVQGRLQGQLREPLLRTICLMKIGMKPMEIAQVMDTKKQTAWNRVKRAEAACGDLISPNLSAL